MKYEKNTWKALLAAGMVVAGSILTGCQNNNNSYDNGTINREAPAGDATTMDSTQGTAVNESMTSRDNVSDRPVSDAGSTATAPKKGTRGKASVNMKRMAAETSSMAVRDADGVYSRADVMPMFPGGEKALQQFVEDNIGYPEEAVEEGTEGDIRVVFTVNEKGKVTNVQAMHPDNTLYSLKEEAVAAMNRMPDWTPGKVKGRNVKTRMTLPISFQIIE